MKFEINLQELLTDEYGNMETLSESVRRQVVTTLTTKVSEGIRSQIDAEVSRVLSEELHAAVKEKMPALLEDLMNAEYKTVDQWGHKAKETTTFRKELVNTITSQMNYKKASYDSDKNAFTRAVDAVISENVREMQKEFDKQIIQIFQKEAFEYAMKSMAAKLQVKL